MARKRQQNIIRTDYIESRISHFQATRQHEKADCLRKLAREIAAPIDEGLIKKEIEQRRIFLRG